MAAASIRIMDRHSSDATDHKGRTVESIVRRLYGKKAFIRYSADRNAPEVGLVVIPAGQNSYNVEAKVFAADGDHEAETVPED